jgi:hypothetical protein
MARKKKPQDEKKSQDEKPERKAIDITVAAQKSAFTVGEFCALHSISRVKYYQLKKERKGPRVFLVGSHERITAEAAAEWRKTMQDEAERSGAGK